MNTFKRQVLLQLFRLADLAVLAISFVVAVGFSNGPTNREVFTRLIEMRISLRNLFLFMVLLIVWHLILASMSLYNSRRLSDTAGEFIDILKGTAFCTVTLFISVLFYPMSAISIRMIQIFFVLSSVLLIVSRIAMRFLLARLRLRGMNLRNVIIVGTNRNALRYAETITSTPELGYILKGFADSEWVAPEPPSKPYHKILCGFSNFSKYLRDHVIDEVFICAPVSAFYDEIQEIISNCIEQGILVRLKTDIFKFENAHLKAETLGESIMLTFVTGGMRRRLRVVKIAFDLLLGLLLLLLASPVLLLAALAIKLTSPGPVLFVQERLGFNKRRFKLYKFRTMVPDAEDAIKDLEELNEMKGPVFKIKNDPRITPIGKFLRKLSIDELPQLLNVIKGEMSLVGPRPLPVRDYEGFNADWHRRRFCIKPGITCLWQISGRNNITFDQWMALDMYYIDHWSPMLDFKILLKTVPAVLSGHGAC